MTGVEFIMRERKRSFEKGWDIEHDKKENASGELILAAMCYLATKKSGGPMLFFRSDVLPFMFPWPEKDWKPTPQNRIRELARAGALIAAEIDRLKNSV